MQTITVQELRLRIENDEPLNLVDVRAPFEHEEYNIGGLLVPLDDIANMQTESLDHLRNEEVILYCRSGNRSLQAALILSQLGFTNTVNLQGGMNAWREQAENKQA